MLLRSASQALYKRKADNRQYDFRRIVFDGIRCSKRGLMKFLVLWHFDVSRLTPDVVRAIAEQPKYGERLEADGKLECRYHVVGSHGGAWIYNVTSNEELDRLLAMSPVYNFATYQVLALADMSDPYTVAGKSK